MNPNDSTIPQLPTALRTNGEIEGQNRIVKNEFNKICTEIRHTIRGSCDYKIVFAM